MIRLFTLVIIFIISITNSYSQTCTATSSGGMTGGSRATWSCGSPGSFTGDLIVIPDGITVRISNNQSWNANVEVRGVMIFENQLSLGSGSGCGLTFIVTSTGLIQDETGNSSNDRLIICGTTVITSQDNPAPSPPAQVWPTGGFSNTGFDESGENASLLPIELLSFEANEYANGVKVSWQTTSEQNNDYFTLERSKDGRNFSELAIVAGAGTTNQTQSYSFIDENPFTGTSYYRLRQRDFDGASETFRPVSVSIEHSTSMFSLYPNPLDQEKLMLTSHVSAFQVKIYNLQGKEIFHKNIDSTDSGYLNTELDLSHLPIGSYMVSLISSLEQYHTKLIKR